MIEKSAEKHSIISTDFKNNEISGQLASKEIKNKGFSFSFQKPFDDFPRNSEIITIESSEDQEPSRQPKRSTPDFGKFKYQISMKNNIYASISNHFSVEKQILSFKKSEKTQNLSNLQQKKIQSFNKYPYPNNFYNIASAHTQSAQILFNTIFKRQFGFQGSNCYQINPYSRTNINLNNFHLHLNQLDKKYNPQSYALKQEHFMPLFSQEKKKQKKEAKVFIKKQVKQQVKGQMVQVLCLDDEDQGMDIQKFDKQNQKTADIKESSTIKQREARHDDIFEIIRSKKPKKYDYSVNGMSRYKYKKFMAQKQKEKIQKTSLIQKQQKFKVIAQQLQQPKQSKEMSKKYSQKSESQDDCSQYNQKEQHEEKVSLKIQRINKKIKKFELKKKYKKIIDHNQWVPKCPINLQSVKPKRPSLLLPINQNKTFAMVPEMINKNGENILKRSELILKKKMSLLNRQFVQTTNLAYQRKIDDENNDSYDQF